MQELHTAVTVNVNLQGRRAADDVECGRQQGSDRLLQLAALGAAGGRERAKDERVERLQHTSAPPHLGRRLDVPALAGAGQVLADVQLGG